VNHNQNQDTLAGWLEGQKDRLHVFPGGSDYWVRYRSIADWLAENVHADLNRAALCIDGEYLTDHGQKHIEKVIDRASKLAMTEQCQMTPYETYLLLVAIQLHDVGNIFGRLHHEEKIAEIVAQMGSLCGEDNVEKRWFMMIAQAHGGEINGDRDKIGRLPRNEAILGLPVRIQFLAAILRFADELAEDRTRAARFSLNTGIVPKENEAYHKYAQYLHSVMVDPDNREIGMSFYVPVNDVRKKFGKGRGGDVYLLDEIFGRTVKTHVERMYCSRFLRPQIEIDTINVKIEICAQKFSEVLETIDYKLVERGYPENPPGGVHALCPELNEWKTIGRLDGDSLHRCLGEAAREDRNG